MAGLLTFSFQPLDGAKFAVLFHVRFVLHAVTSACIYMRVIPVTQDAVIEMLGFTFYTQLQLKLYSDYYLYLKPYGSLPLVIYLLLRKDNLSFEGDETELDVTANTRLKLAKLLQFLFSYFP